MFRWPVVVTVVHAAILGMALAFVENFAIDWLNHEWLASYVAHQA
jgi:hypothetical protein